jgi:Flp pilus assembly CpaE family ATPase
MTAIAICSGKGSPGTTFVAINLSAAIGRSGREVLLVDLDPAGGDVCCYLALDPRRGLYPMLRLEGGVPEHGRLLAETEEKTGALVLSGFPEQSNLASPQMLAAIVKTARAGDHTVLVDLGRVSDAVVPTAAEADRVILVVRPDLVSVLGAERAFRRLEGGDVPRERIDVVVSCLDRRRPGDLAEVGEALGLEILASVPFDRRGARKALLQQEPATTRRLRRAFDRLAERVLGQVDGNERAPVDEPVGVSA